ncbi:MAG: hypothetical protein ABL927_12870 [Bdellovibrionales bacterium]
MKKIFEAAKLLFPAFLELHKDQLGDRKGIMIALNEISNSKSGHHFLIGEMPEEKTKERQQYAYEKIERLRERNEKGFAELTSFASENAKEGKFGGGIKTKNYYMSGSGLPPHLDQKFMMLVALFVDELSFTAALQIMEESFLPRMAWEKEPGK